MSLLAGFSDLDNDVLSVTNLTTNHGALADNHNGTWTFTPAANHNGPVSLGYDVVDGNGGSLTAVQSFTLTAVNDAPTGAPTALLAPGTEDTAYGLSAATLLQGFSDVDGDTLSVANLSANHGALVDNANGTWTFTPAANYNGPVSLSYNVIDGHAGSVAAAEGFTLTAVNDPAVLGSADVTVPETNAAITATGALAIVDVDSPAAFVAQPATAGRYGAFTIGANGQWTYKATLAFDYLNPGDTLKDTFQVKSSDGGTSSVSVTITGTAEVGTIRLGDAPAAQSGTGGQWAQAWTQTGYVITHKADAGNLAAAWSAVKFNAVSSQLLAGGDIYAGDLGVSGQSAATSTVRQEINGREALRVSLPTSADSVTIKLTRLFTNDDGSALSESGLLRLLDAAGAVVAEKAFWADVTAGTKTVTLEAAGGFASMELLAGAYDSAGTFVYGGYSTAGGGFGGAISTDAAGKLHGSDFLLDWVEFSVPLVGVAAMADAFGAEG